MSWDEISKKEVKCPCGKGLVVLTTYGDDWNRFKESVSIDCRECKKMYDVVSKTHQGLLASDGSWTEYALLIKGYPESPYSFTQIINVPKDAPFYVYLIREYLKSELVDILEEYQSITRVKDLRGIYKRVAKDSMERTGSAIRENIIADINNALLHYDEDSANREIFEDNEKVRKQKQDEYLRERDKHLIKLNF